jgi:hypothetical protein
MFDNRRLLPIDARWACFVVTSLVVWFPCFLGWVVAFSKYKSGKDSCNHRVNAVVVEQLNVPHIDDTCDVKLGWRDTRRDYRETILRWRCDPTVLRPRVFELSSSISTTAVASAAASFSRPTCYKEGEQELRVMDVHDYTYFDRQSERFSTHTYREPDDISHVVVSTSSVDRWKKISTALLIVWVVVVSPLVVIVCIGCLYASASYCVYRISRRNTYKRTERGEEEKERQGIENEQPPPSDGITTPASFYV